MATVHKKHLRYDQQEPFEEPKEPSQAPITSDMFARRPPTPEDEYFFRKEHDLPKPEIRTYGSEKEESPADQPGSIWQRIYRFFSSGFDTKWRP